MNVVRIPRRLKKVIKNFLKNNPFAVYHTTKKHMAYFFILQSGKLRIIWRSSQELEENYGKVITK